VRCARSGVGGVAVHDEQRADLPGSHVLHQVRQRRRLVDWVCNRRDELKRVSTRAKLLVDGHPPGPPSSARFPQLTSIRQMWEQGCETFPLPVVRPGAHVREYRLRALRASALPDRRILSAVQPDRGHWIGGRECRMVGRIGKALRLEGEARGLAINHTTATGDGAVWCESQLPDRSSDRARGRRGAAPGLGRCLA
jgi:hypothetical protein